MSDQENRQLEGILPALVTAFDESGSVNGKAQRELIEFLINCKVDGFYLCGGTGEGLSLTVEERKRLLEIAVDQVRGRVRLIDHIGAYQTADTLELAKHAAGAGAD